METDGKEAGAARMVKRDDDGDESAAAWSPRAWAALVAVVALCVGARVWRLGESCLWFDEIFGLHAARHGWGGLLRFAALDLIHPPLFYLMLKAWVAAGGESAWWARLLPAAFASAAVVPVALLGRELGLTRRATAAALVLLAASGYLIKYAQEVRMYAPLLFWAACSLWLLARLCAAEGDGRRRRRASAALALVNLLLVYTHYFGWLLVGLELAFVLAWRRELAREFAKWTAAVALLFAPWAWAVWRAAEGGASAAQNIGWIVRPRLRDLPLPYLLLHEPFRFQRHSHEPAVLPLSAALAIALFAPPLAALAWRTLTHRRSDTQGEASTDETDERRGETETGEQNGQRGGSSEANSLRVEAATEDEADERRGEATDDRARGLRAGRERFALRFLVFFSVAPVVVAFALAHLLPHSVWGTRHLVVVAPAYLLLAAHAVTSVRPGWVAATFCALVGCWLLLAAGLALTRQPTEPVWCAWGTLARQAASESDMSEPGEMRIYAFEDLAAYQLWYESGAGGEGRAARVAVVRGVAGVVEDRAFFLPRGFAGVDVLGEGEAFREPRFWVALRAARAESHPVWRLLAERGYAVERRLEVRAQGQTALMLLAARR